MWPCPVGSLWSVPGPGHTVGLKERSSQHSKEGTLQKRTLPDLRSLGFSAGTCSQHPKRTEALAPSLQTTRSFTSSRECALGRKCTGVTRGCGQCAVLDAALQATQVHALV